MQQTFMARIVVIEEDGHHRGFHAEVSICEFDPEGNIKDTMVALVRRSVTQERLDDMGLDREVVADEVRRQLWAKVGDALHQYVSGGQNQAIGDKFRRWKRTIVTERQALHHSAGRQGDRRCL